MALPKLNFIARLSRDSETTYSGAGMAICKLGLICSEKYKDKENKFMITGTAFNKTAEIISSVHKGQRIFVSGRIQTDMWEDRETGKPRSAPSMIIESFEFIEPKSDNQGQQGQQNNQQNFQQQGQQGGGFQNQQQNNGGFQGPPDDDIPF